MLRYFGPWGEGSTLTAVVAEGEVRDAPCLDYRAFSDMAVSNNLGAHSGSG